MVRSASKPASPNAARRRTPEPTLPAARLLDAAESLGEEFAEALEHVIRQPPFQEWRIGPVHEIPLGELTPGALGWRTGLERPAGPSEAGDPARRADEEVVCVLVPSVVAIRAGFSPFREARSGTKVVVRESPGWPRRVLAVRTRTGSGRTRFSGFLDALAREMADDEEPAEPEAVPP